MHSPKPDWLTPALVQRLRSAMAERCGPDSAREECHATLFSGLSANEIDQTDPLEWLLDPDLPRPIPEPRRSFGPAWSNGRSNQLTKACDKIHRAAAAASRTASADLILRLASAHRCSLREIGELLDEPPEWVMAVAGDITGELANNRTVKLAVGGALSAVGATAAALELRDDEDDGPKARHSHEDVSTVTSSSSASVSVLVLCGLLVLPAVLALVFIMGGNQPEPGPDNAGNSGVTTRPVAPGPNADQRVASTEPEEVESTADQPASVDPTKVGQSQPVSEPEPMPEQPVADKPPVFQVGPPSGFSDPDGLLPGERVWGRVSEAPDKWQFPTFYEDLETWGDKRLVVRELRDPKDGSLTGLLTYLPGTRIPNQTGPSRRFVPGKIFEYHGSLERENLLDVGQFANNMAIGRFWNRNNVSDAWRLIDEGLRDVSLAYLGATEELGAEKRSKLGRVREKVAGDGHVADPVPLHGERPQGTKPETESK